MEPSFLLDDCCHTIYEFHEPPFVYMTRGVRRYPSLDSPLGLTVLLCLYNHNDQCVIVSTASQAKESHRWN